MKSLHINQLQVLFDILTFSTTYLNILIWRKKMLITLKTAKLDTMHVEMMSIFPHLCCDLKASHSGTYSPIFEG